MTSKEQLPPSATGSPSANQPPSSVAWNPLSLRLYKVLGANYEDSATKEALETLSAFYAEPSAAITSNTNGYRESDQSDDGEEEERIFNSSLTRGIAGRARKNLRRDTEVRLTEESQRVLKAFSEVDEVHNFC